jgi:tetratricopeptide (TPR) repeat protein
MSEDLRVSIIARRGIEQMKEGIYAEAQQQFEAALKLDRSNSWVYYNLGLLFLEQRNWQQALDNLEASLIGNLKPSWIEVWAHQAWQCLRCEGRTPTRRPGVQQGGAVGN